MATILLSIKPEYVDKIFSGSKKYEFRKHLPQKRVDKIVIYSTDPVQKIVGEVDVLGTVSMKPSPLWETTKDAAGISREKFRFYFKGCSTAHAFKLGQAYKYDTPKVLADLGVNSAPQSFVYIKRV